MGPAADLEEPAAWVAPVPVERVLAARAPAAPAGQAGRGPVAPVPAARPVLVVSVVAESVVPAARAAEATST